MRNAGSIDSESLYNLLLNDYAYEKSKIRTGTKFIKCSGKHSLTKMDSEGIFENSTTEYSIYTDADCFHRLGYQKWYTTKYKTVIRNMLQNLDFHLESLEDEQHCIEASSEHFYDMILNTPDSYFKHEKIQKNQKKYKKPEKYYYTSLYYL
jgi:hypothetical protein